LSLGEVGRLLNAAVERLAWELLTIRKGRRKGQLVATVRDSALARARQLGWERRLC